MNKSEYDRTMNETQSLKAQVNKAETDIKDADEQTRLSEKTI